LDKTFHPNQVPPKYHSGNYYYLFKLEVFPYEVFTQGTRQLPTSHEVGGGRQYGSRATRVRGERQDKNTLTTEGQLL